MVSVKGGRRLSFLGAVERAGVGVESCYPVAVDRLQRREPLGWNHVGPLSVVWEGGVGGSSHGRQRSFSRSVWGDVPTVTTLGVRTETPTTATFEPDHTVSYLQLNTDPPDPPDEVPGRRVLTGPRETGLAVTAILSSGFKVSNTGTRWTAGSFGVGF